MSDGTRTTRTTSHWGTYDVTTAGGRIVGTGPAGIDEHPSPIQASLPEMVTDRTRIDQPYVRSGYLRHGPDSRDRRGSDPYVAVSWDRALALVADALVEARERGGDESVYGGSYGWASAGRLHHAPSVLKRFLGMQGGYTDKIGNHSFGAALGLAPYVLGRRDVPHLSARWDEIVEHTELLVLFGGAAIKNAQVNPGGAFDHATEGWQDRLRAAGVEVVCVSPQRDDAVASLDATWLPVRPQTDAALMLALAHELVEQRLVPTDFARSHCVGFDELWVYLSGQSDGQVKDAQWASRITGLPAEAIEQLARRMAAGRTMVNCAWAVQRAQHGEQPVWATIALAAILGQIGLPGGGFSLGLGAVAGQGPPYAARVPRPKLSLGDNPVTTRVPVGRVHDLLLRPGETLEHNGEVLRLPPTELVYSAGGNPFHHNLDLNRFVRAWQQPATVIVHEPWWSPPAKYADIVLPSTTTLERNDIAAADLTSHWLAMKQVVAPVAQSRHDFDIFSELADRLGFGERYHEGRSEMQWLAHMYAEARDAAVERGYAPPPFEEFWERGGYEFPDDGEHETLLADFRADPAAHPLETASGRIELVSETIRGYAYDDCPAHPTWLEPAEWLGGERASTYPLHLLTNQPRGKLHSQLDHSSHSRAQKVGGREALLMTADDAAARGITELDVVRVFNDRGAFLAAVRLVPAGELLPGVVCMPTGAWFDPVEPGVPGSLEKHGNPNVVTSARGTSRLSQATAAQTCLVEVETYADPPAVTAFDLPEIVAEPPVEEG